MWVIFAHRTPEIMKLPKICLQQHPKYIHLKSNSLLGGGRREVVVTYDYTGMGKFFWLFIYEPHVLQKISLNFTE